MAAITIDIISSHQTTLWLGRMLILMVTTMIMPWLITSKSNPATDPRNICEMTRIATTTTTTTATAHYTSQTILRVPGSFPTHHRRPLGHGDHRSRSHARRTQTQTKLETTARGVQEPTGHRRGLQLFGIQIPDGRSGCRGGGPVFEVVATIVAVVVPVVAVVQALVVIETWSNTERAWGSLEGAPGRVQPILAMRRGLMPKWILNLVVSGLVVALQSRLFQIRRLRLWVVAVCDPRVGLKNACWG